MTDTDRSNTDRTGTDRTGTDRTETAWPGIDPTRADWAGVRQRIEALRQHPRRDRVFGALGHRFALEPALSTADLAELETWLGVTLPADYRSFLTDVGAGGAGPCYGVFPVHRDGEGGWHWLGDGAALTEPALLAEPFVLDRASADALAELDASCPHEDDFDDVERFDDAYAEWEQRLAEVLWDPTLTSGAICLVHEGCARRFWLVASGPVAGTIWYDPRTDEQDLAPVPGPDGSPYVTFGQWYLGWLVEVERIVLAG